MTLCQSIRPNHPLRRGTILLVEDEPFVREATRSILAHAGFEVLPPRTQAKPCKSTSSAIAPSIC